MPTTWFVRKIQNNYEATNSHLKQGERFPTKASVSVTALHLLAGHRTSRSYRYIRDIHHSLDFQRRVKNDTALHNIIHNDQNKSSSPPLSGGFPFSKTIFTSDLRTVSVQGRKNNEYELCMIKGCGPIKIYSCKGDSSWLF